MACGYSCTSSVLSLDKASWLRPSALLTGVVSFTHVTLKGICHFKYLKKKLDDIV